jgi:tRNA (cytosine49-C5)-methyltransferase
MFNPFTKTIDCFKCICILKIYMKLKNKAKDFLPPMFIEKVKKMFEAKGLSENKIEKEIEEFKIKTNTRLRKTIRLNTIKGSKKTIENLEKKDFKLENIPWYKYGYFISNTDEEFKALRVGNTLEHFVGEIYIQEASSMLPVIVLDPKPNENVLDIAAAPGSKTTQIAMHMKNTGMICANEPLIQRIKALQDNIERTGVINTMVTRNDGRFLKRIDSFFDRILVDAPCSGEGFFRKDLKARYLWNPKRVIADSKLQFHLLRSAVLAAKKGATIVYSTCTFSPEENEFVVNKILEKYDVKLEKIKIDNLETDEGLTNYDGTELDKELKKTIRIWPHKANLEGFFVAKIKKIGETNAN